MQEVKYTCDKCGLSIQPLDPAFQGAGELIIIARVNGGMGHNRIPFNGWHFHYSCCSIVVDAIIKTFDIEK